MLSKRIVGRGLAGGLGIILTIAFSGSSVSATHGAAKPVRGGTFTVSHSIEPRYFDPIVATGQATLSGDGRQLYPIYDALAFIDVADGGTVVPKTLQSVTSTDGIAWTLKVRPKIKFTDGTDYDAAAVKFNWERIADPKNASANATAAQQIASMEVVDPLTLKVTLKTANGQFPRVIATNLPLVASPAAIRAQGANYGQTPASTVGAGPFLLRDFVRGSQTTLERNPNYWDKPKPYIDRLVIQLISDPTQRFNSAIGGATEMSGPTTLLPAQATQAKSAGLRGFAAPPFTYVGLWALMNTSVPPLNDVRVRKGIQQAVDWKGYNDSINAGGAFTLDYHVLRQPGPFYEKSLALPKYDQAAAQKLFDEYFAATGKEIQINLRPATGVVNWGEFLQAQLIRYNHVKATIDTLVAAQALSIYGAKQYGMAFLPINSYDPEPSLFDLLHTGGVREFQGYSNPQMDAALDKGRASTNVKDRIEAYKTVQELIVRDQPGLWLPVVSQLPTHLLSKTVLGYELASGFPLYERVWFKKTKK